MVRQMRKTSQHGQCKICFDHYLVLRNPKADWETKARAARNLREHQRQQYVDRTLYWSLRWSSTHNRSCLVIIIDGMGKFGTAWPHFGHDRASKEMDGIIRPKMVLTGALAHGWGTFLFGTSEQRNHGSEAWHGYSGPVVIWLR